MQFLFGKNKDKKYGVINADMPTSEAEQLRVNINFDISKDIDAYGYINCGVNTPMFFRIAIDESTEKKDYYIHGIAKKVENAYFAGEEFVNDVFLNFADNAALASARSDNALPNISVNSALSAENAEINDEVIKEILVRLYQGEDFILSVDDEVYSTDYARCAMAKLYSYMTPSLRKACGYAIGVSDIGSTHGIKLRIAPESMLKSNFEPYCELSAVSHKCIAESDVLAMVNAIMNANDVEKEKIFSSFEKIFGGVDYKAKNFFDFWEAYQGNAVVAEKLFDGYLASFPNPSKEDVPRFISAALAEKYRSESALEGIIKLESLREILSPRAVLLKYEKEIKKLYLLYPAPTHYISSIYTKAFATVVLTDGDIDTITAGIKTFATRDKSNKPKFIECFETAADNAYSDFANKRLSKCIELRQRVNLYVERTFLKLPQQAIEENEVDKVRTAFEHNVSAAVQEAEKYGFDLTSSFNLVFDKTLKAHNEKHRPAVIWDLAKLDAVTKALVSKNIAISDKDMLVVVENFSDYPNIVDLCVAKYALKQKIFPKIKNNIVLDTMAAKKGRLINVASLMMDYDPLASLYLLACYAPILEAFEGIEKLITANGEVFNALNAKKVRKDINNIGEMLHQRMGEEAIDSEEVLIILENFSETNKSLTGVCKLTAGALMSAYKAYCKGGKFAPKMNTAPLWTILYILLAAALIAGGAFLVKKYIIDGDFKLGGGDTSVTDSSDVSSDNTSDSNSDASSGTSSDTSSDVSSDVSSDTSSDTSNTSSDISSDVSSDTSSDTSSGSGSTENQITGFEDVGEEVYIEYVNMNVNDTHVIAIDSINENSRYAANRGTWEYCLLLKPIEGHEGYYQVERVLTNVKGRDVLFGKTIEEFNNGGYVVLAFHLKEETTAEDDTDYAERLEDAKLIGNGDYVALGDYDGSIKQLQPITATFREVTPIYS